MSFLEEGLRQAWQMLTSGDPRLMQILWVTAKVAFLPTAVATVVGVPLGLLIGQARGRGAAVWRMLANVGLGLPPVVVGVVLALLMFPGAPLGRFHLLFTLRGVYLAQLVLAFPIVVALTSSAVRGVAPGLLLQARAFGASRWRLGALSVREARVGILAAIIAAVGSALSEVGAIALVGGNIDGLDRTLATEALYQIDAGAFVQGAAIGFILLAVILLVTALLTWLQYGGRGRRPGLLP